MLTVTLPYPIKGPGVYCIRDSQSTRFYIGSSVNVSKRWMQHQGRLAKGTHPNPRLQAIWNKEKNRLTIGTVVAVPRGTREALLAEEQKALDAAGVGANPDCLNVLCIAGSHLGAKRSVETRQRLSIAQRGKSPTLETRAKMRAAKVGKPLSEEHRRKVGLAGLGRKYDRKKGVRKQTTLRALSTEQVIALRAKRKEGMSWRLLGAEFGIHQSAARRIAIGQTYQEIPL